MKPLPVVTLQTMRKGETGYIIEVEGGGGLAEKLKAMGLFNGSHIKKQSSPDSGGPAVVEVLGTRLALGQGIASRIMVRVRSRRILLAGNPNVGKSVVFSRLTGLDVISSNYPGSSVEFTSGQAVIAGERFSILDVPGAYSSQGMNKAEEAAAKLLAEEDKALIVNVVDATNLERNLFYTLELASAGVPMLILLNKWDIAVRRGVTIDAAKLAGHLGVKVIPFVATTGEGLSAFKAAIEDFIFGNLAAPALPPAGSDERWKLIGRISADCQRIEHKHTTLLEKLQDITSRPSTGIPFAACVLLAAFFAIRFAGEGLTNYVLDPLFKNLWMPFLTGALGGLAEGSFVKTLLLGLAPEPMRSFGLLTTGLYIPFVTVLPYIVSFYFVLGLLEDIGYLPRLAVLLDSSMHRLGLHGYGTIPLMLGLGCKVPAIMATRVLETRRERIIAAALTLGLAPCMPQTAMILSLLAPYPVKYTLTAFGFVALAGLTSSFLLSRMVKGETPELFVEIPPYQAPCCNILARKLYLRVKEYLTEAVPMIAAGVVVINLLELSGALAELTVLLGPAVHSLLGLPPDTVSVMTLGFLRKDVSIAMLAPFALAPGSIVVASIFLSLYLPCLGTFAVTLRELGAKDSAKVFAMNFTAALATASLLNLALRFL